MKWKKLLLIVAVVLLLGAAGFLLWALTPLGPAPEALAALESSASVDVEVMPGLVAFYPKERAPEVGFVFYPGGRVDYRSYSPALQEIAAQGYLVLLPKMPLSFAFLDINAAAEIIFAYPQIESWAVGGHSLGGAMAASFAHENSGLIDGLVLWASYPPNSSDFSEDDLPAISIYGTLDGRVEDISASESLLPDSTIWVAIEGGNHAQFGSYGPQPGDLEALISSEEQQEAVVDATVDFLELLE